MNKKHIPLHRLTDEELDEVAEKLVKEVKAEWRKERRRNPYDENPELLKVNR